MRFSFCIHFLYFYTATIHQGPDDCGQGFHWKLEGEVLKSFCEFGWIYSVQKPPGKLPLLPQSPSHKLLQTGKHGRSRAVFVWGVYLGCRLVIFLRSPSNEWCGAKRSKMYSYFLEDGNRFCFFFFALRLSYFQKTAPAEPFQKSQDKKSIRAELSNKWLFLYKQPFGKHMPIRIPHISSSFASL